MKSTQKINEYTNNGKIKFRQKYIDLAIELNEKYNNKIKTEDGIISLADDLREVNNHGINLGDEYIEFNIKNKFYDKDPYCTKRLLINILEEIENELENRKLNIKQYNPKDLFTYSKVKEINEIVDDLLKKEIFH